MTDQVTTKVCSKCKVEKLVMLFGKDKSAKDGLTHNCRDCRNKISLEFYKNNKDKVLIRSRSYNDTNRIKLASSARAYRNKNMERFLYCQAKRRKYEVDNLTDAYVAKRLSLKLSKCPQELIELKRINLLITREIRNQQQCQN